MNVSDLKCQLAQEQILPLHLIIMLLHPVFHSHADICHLDYLVLQINDAIKIIIKTYGYF